MKKKLIIFLILSSLILTGFTVKNYNEWEEPDWFDYSKITENVNANDEIFNKVLVAIDKLDEKGLQMAGINIKISPHKYKGINGVVSKNTAVIANNSYDTIYHELGHLYHNNNRLLVEKYERAMKEHYPGLEIEQADFDDWHGSIREDFAEEFRVLFTGGEKRTLYPPFPNFYEWLLRNTQPIEITRKEVFDKLGGTDKLIKEGIVIGNENGDYMLSKPITRGEVATILVRLKGFTKEKQVPFTDIKNQWYSGYVRKIYNEGLIKGLPNNTFAGDKLITRYELHMILERL